MNNYTDGQFQKLPKWAQLEIKRLEIKNADLSKRLDEFTGELKTNTYVRNGLTLSPLPNGSVVEFMVNDTNVTSVYIKNDGSVNINTSGDDMAIKPRSSNCFDIVFTKK